MLLIFLSNAAAQGGGGEGLVVIIIVAVASPMFTFLAAMVASRRGWLGTVMQQQTTLALGLDTNKTVQETAVIKELFERLEKQEAHTARCEQELATERRERVREVTELNADLNSVWGTVDIILHERPELEKVVEDTRERMERRRQAQRDKMLLRQSGEIYLSRPTEASGEVEKQ